MRDIYVRHESSGRYAQTDYENGITQRLLLEHNGSLNGIAVKQGCIRLLGSGSLGDKRTENERCRCACRLPEMSDLHNGNRI